MRKKKVDFKYILSTIFVFFLVFSTVNATVYNSEGDFSVDVEKLKHSTLNNNIDVIFDFELENNLNEGQDFQLILNPKSGWDINVEDTEFMLTQGAKKKISLNLVANSNFDYSPNVVSPDVIQIVQKEDYTGYFEFPLIIVGENENISLKFEVQIEKPIKPEVEFVTKFSNEELSPASPFKFTITGQNLEDEKLVDIKVRLGNTILADFQDSFTPKNNYKIYQQEILPTIEPGKYNVIVTARFKLDSKNTVKESFEEKELEVVEFVDLESKDDYKKSFFKETYIFNVENKGNIDSVYKKNVNVSFLNSLFFGSNLDYEKNDGLRTFEVEVKKGETVEFKYYYNYLSLYLILIAIVILISYIYIRKNSNPLDVETKIYEINRVEHEGVKSLKLRIGFENIKEAEIEVLKLVFRMPSYLNVKDGSFLLTEPKHVLKGRNQYKLIWDFKNFEKNDSRIIGFQMINKKGVLGDIRIPDLEIEVKINGKLRKYYKSFPIVRG